MWYHALFLLASAMIIYIASIAFEQEHGAILGVLYLIVGIASFCYFAFRCRIKCKRGKFPEEEDM
jgi:hypothetical protein